MDKELYEKLTDKYTFLFTDIIRPIECGGGWYDIIKNMCYMMHRYNIMHSNKVKITQIKEKFGILAVYTNMNLDKDIQNIISDAIIQSKMTCEDCGKYGHLVQIDGYYMVLCFKHIVLTYIDLLFNKFKI